MPTSGMGWKLGLAQIEGLQLARLGRPAIPRKIPDNLTQWQESVDFVDWVWPGVFPSEMHL